MVYKIPTDLQLDSDPGAWGDWDHIVETMETQELADLPGTTPAYHTVTFGWLVGELVRQITGVPIAEYAQEHVFEPLGMLDILPALKGEDSRTLGY